MEQIRPSLCAIYMGIFHEYSDSVLEQTEHMVQKAMLVPSSAEFPCYIVILGCLYQ